MIKRCQVAAFVIGCALQSCQLLPDVLPVQSPDEEVQAPDIVNGPAKAITIYSIREGAHYADSNPFMRVQTNTLRFAATFDSTAIYSTLDPANQGDINKLYGLSDCSSDHHTNSARFGWRWYEGKLELHAYVYQNKVRKSAYVTDVVLGEATVCGIKLEEGQYVFTAGGQTVLLPRGCNGMGEGYQLYPYFGGDEAAPHPITIAIQELP
ncbi:hypothetical protein GCM10023188_09560 [Pontibacter saemangeumensis]|uniref:Lipoprotein n=1 Tax=Pontibacter saemangeumensis TaxID=1084525 RepID=A0ABP8LEM6_9BACT